MKKAFKEYLIKNGYRQVTGSDNPDIVYDDCRRVDRVAKEENLTWEELAEKIEEKTDLQCISPFMHLMVLLFIQ